MKDAYTDRIESIVEYLNKQVESTPTLEDLAAVAKISPYHFNRVFRAVTGETPMGTLRRLRIARAAVMLRDTEKPITEIAFDVGYESSQAFSKAFRQLTGGSASAARSERQKLDSLIDELSSPRVRQVDVNVEVRLVSVEPFKVIASRHIGPPEGLFSAFGELFSWAENAGLIEDYRGIYGIPIDDPRDDFGDGPRFDCCFDFGPDVRSSAPYNDAKLGGGSYAVARHTGPYEGLDDLYDHLYGSWLRTAPYELRDTCSYNHYLADPESVPPEQWETDVYIPIEKTG